MTHDIQTKTDQLTEEELKLIEDHVQKTIREMSGDPLCKLGCHGTGRLGIRINKDGTRTVITCKCGRVGVNDYAMMNQELAGLKNAVLILTDYTSNQHDQLRQKVGESTALVADSMDYTKRLAFWSPLVRAWRRIRGNEKVQKATLTPVVGEVKA